MMTSTLNRLSALARHRAKVVVAIVAIAGTGIAATFFVPQDQPWGYVAEPALSAQSLNDGGAVAYVPWFETGTMRGDILAMPLSTAGTVGFVPLWRASENVDTQDWNTGRRIITSDGLNTGVPFRYDSLTPVQQAELDIFPANAQALLDFIRGRRDGEGTTFRERNTVMGTVVHMAPEYVATPRKAYDLAGYNEYVIANALRAGRVYAGANDGMVHAFDAETGEEVFAYVPSMILDQLHNIADLGATHHYLVDGELTAEDGQIESIWGTYLLGTLGAGGRGIFALDVTDPTAADENAAAAKVLWELHPGSPGTANLGYTYSRPSIVRLETGLGTWRVIVGNGFMSDTGIASIYIVDLKNGNIIKEITVPDMDNNGMASPTVIDSDSDGYADTAYAGDRNGNLWKIDIKNGRLAYGGRPLFTAPAGQPITTPPKVLIHPEGGFMVYVGTGEMLRPEDGNDKTMQAVYGIWDNGEPVAIEELVVNRLKNVLHPSGILTRTATNNRPDWSIHKGWVLPAQVVAASDADMGERVLQEMELRNYRLSFTLVNPTIPTGENWLIMVDAMSGGAPSETILDINEDNILDVTDNSDGNEDGAITDTALDRVVGQYQQFGLASRPLIVRQDSKKDSLLINHLAAIPPTGVPPLPEEIPPDIVIDPGDFGVYGGHFDLDTSSQWYAFAAGDTDGHVHEWDDKWNRTTVDLFDLPDAGTLFNIQDIVASGDRLMLTVGNTALSSAAVLEINGVTISAVDYHALQNRFLSGRLRGNEMFPLYKLGSVGGGDYDKGYRQLTSLKVTFSAYAIVTGGLIPTETGCVRGNDQGAAGEYRNGAFIIQASKDDKALDSGFVYDPVIDAFVGEKTTVHAEHGHVMSNNIEYESSLFWHWDGDCYHQSTWETQYQACVVNGGCWSAALAADGEGKTSDKDGTKDSDKDGTTTTEPVPDSGSTPTDPVVEQDPDHDLSETTIRGGEASIGRLFWREVVPE